MAPTHTSASRRTSQRTVLTDLVEVSEILAPGEAQVLFQDERSAYRQATPGECQADYLLRGTVLRNAPRQA